MCLFRNKFIIHKCTCVYLPVYVPATSNTVAPGVKWSITEARSTAGLSVKRQGSSSHSHVGEQPSPPKVLPNRAQVRIPTAGSERSIPYGDYTSISYDNQLDNQNTVFALLALFANAVAAGRRSRRGTNEAHESNQRKSWDPSTTPHAGVLHRGCRQFWMQGFFYHSKEPQMGSLPHTPEHSRCHNFNDFGRHFT